MLPDGFTVKMDFSSHSLICFSSLTLFLQPLTNETSSFYIFLYIFLCVFKFFSGPAICRLTAQPTARVIVSTIRTVQALDATFLVRNTHTHSPGFPKAF